MAFVEPVKAWLRSTPFYHHHFVRVQSARVRQWTNEDDNLKLLYQQFIKPGSLVFDIGANIGTRLKIFQALGARTVAIEPQRNCIKALIAAFPNSTIVQSAVGSEIGRAWLYEHDIMHPLASLYPTWINRFDARGPSRKESVPVTTLDALITTYGVPDFTKIDVEGAETDVLRGLSQQLPVFSFEFARDLLDDAYKCLSIIGRLGNYEYNFVKTGSAELHLDEWVSRTRLETTLILLTNGGDIYARIRQGITTP